MASPITLHLTDGSLQFSFSVAAAQALKADLDSAIAQIKAASTAPRRSPAPALEHRHSGEVFLEAFCNPNLWASPFAAKVLLTLRDDRLRITAETSLSQIYDDLTLYLEQADT